MAIITKLDILRSQVNDYPECILKDMLLACINMCENRNSDENEQSLKDLIAKVHDLNKD